MLGVCELLLYNKKLKENVGGDLTITCCLFTSGVLESFVRKEEIYLLSSLRRIWIVLWVKMHFLKKFPRFWWKTMLTGSREERSYPCNKILIPYNKKAKIENVRDGYDWSYFEDHEVSTEETKISKLKLLLRQMRKIWLKRSWSND